MKDVRLVRGIRIVLAAASVAWLSTAVSTSGPGPGPIAPKGPDIVVDNADYGRSAVASDASGNFVVFTADGFAGVPSAAQMFKRYDSTGALIGSAPPDPNISENDGARAPDGSFIVGYTQGMVSGYPVQVHFFRADAFPLLTFPVNGGVGNCDNCFWTRPRVAKDFNGGFVVVWEEDVIFGPSVNIYAHAYNSDASERGPVVLVTTAYDDPPNETGGVSHHHPSLNSVSIDGDGNFVVAWTDGFNPPNDPIVGLANVVAQRFNSAGLPASPPFQLNDTNSGGVGSPVVAMDVFGGGFVAAWAAGSYGGVEGINYRLFDNSGPVSPDLVAMANNPTGDANDTRYNLPAIASSRPFGNFVITAQRTFGGTVDIAAEAFDPGAFPVSPIMVANSCVGGFLENADVAVDFNNNFIVSWTGRKNMPCAGVSARRFGPADNTPDPFTFTDQSDVPLNTLRTSNSITVSGLGVPATIHVDGGEYSINGGAFTSTDGTINNGQKVRVRHRSATTPSTPTDTTLTVGSGSDTFTSTTGYTGLSVESSEDFGDQLAGTSGSAHPIVVTNTGTLTLAVGSPTRSGTSPGSFAVTGNTCSGGVAPGATCAISVTFKPTKTGALSATLNIPSNAPSTPDAVALTGNGTGSPVLSVEASEDFGDQLAGTTSSAHPIVVTNTGNIALTVGTPTKGGTNPSSFSIAGNTCTGGIAPGASCTISVTFKPPKPGARSATLSIPSNAPSTPDTVALTGNGTGSAGVAVEASEDFGNQAVATTGTDHPIVVTNTGNITLTVGTLARGGANPSNFVITGNTCAGGVAPGASCTISVAFKPSKAGARSATLSIPSNAPSTPDTVALTGNGV